MDIIIILIISLVLISQILFFISIRKRLSLLENLTKEFTELNGHRKAVISQSNSTLNLWEDEVRRTVELQCLAVRNAIYKQGTELHKKEFELAPKELSISKEILIRVYPPNKITLLEDYWQEYEKYIQSYWLTSKGEYKSVFKGNPTESLSEIGQLALASKELTAKMDSLLKRLTADS